MRYNRNKHLPDSVKDLNFNLDSQQIPDGFLQGDIHTTGVDSTPDSRHIIFATAEQLKRMGEQKVWYIDATFKIVKKPFMQLFSVHVIIKSGDCMKQIPVAFVLMSRRRKKDYIKVFKKLLDLVDSPQVEKIMLDFEAAMWSALRELMANGTLPKVDLRGCLFHFTQAVFRRIIIIGLKDQYWRDAGTRNLCKQCMSLPLIPTEHVPLVFPELKRRLLASEVTLLHQLVPYIENTWINGMWNPSNWGQFDQAIRTNNDVEGFHNKMNHICQKPNVEFSTLVKELHKEAVFIYTTAVHVFRGQT